MARYASTCRRPRSDRFVQSAIVAVLGFVFVRGALGQSDFGLDWITIGAAGNRATIASETPRRPSMSVGRVDFEYRMSRTEITVQQWLEFVNAYWPYANAQISDFGFTGIWIRPTNLTPGEDPRYVVSPGAEDYPTQMSWRYAARYCNWLHNGRVDDAAAFESGAYDTSTFTTNPDGTINDQATRSPGARFWIPSENEWIKAAYFDPHRYGPDQQGYWLHPDAHADPLLSGYPENGGETSAGTAEFAFPAGQYAQNDSPWGLLDVSGGVSEWLENNDGPFPQVRIQRGSFTGDALWQLRDQIDDPGSGIFPDNYFPGLRVAGTVPPPSAAVIIACCLLKPRGRKRCHYC